MYYLAPMPDDVSPLEASRDRRYWAALLDSRTMPGLWLAVDRADQVERATRTLAPGTQPLPQTKQLPERGRSRPGE